jgi:hypothetical protein
VIRRRSAAHARRRAPPMRPAAGANLETGAIDRIELPSRQDRHDARRQLDVHELARCAPLDLNATRPLPAQRMPAIVNNDILPDMGRMTGHDQGAENWACIASLVETCLCRARHKQVYAVRRTMPNGSESSPLFARTYGRSSGHRANSIRHSLAPYSVSRKASRRSLGWKRVRLPCSYGLSFARAASLSARWACR